MKNIKKYLKIAYIAGSICFLSFMVIFYGYRLVHFYIKEHKPKDITYSMIGYLTDEVNLINNKLLKDEDRYYFRKDAQNNYLLFSGILYRILYLDDSNIYLISDEPVTNLKYGITNEYDKSNIKDWLENVYLKNLDRNSLTSDKVYLLDKELYQKVGADESYLVGQDFWMADDNQGLIVDEDGAIKVPNNYETFLGVRPIIELNGYKAYLKGDGTKDNPYLVQDMEREKLSDLDIGAYVEYKDQVFRVIAKDNTAVKLLKVEKLDTQYLYSKTTNVYNIKNNTDLAYYLNNTYLETLNRDDFVLTKWAIGDYHIDYKETKAVMVDSYVGLLSIGDYFITDALNSHLLNISNKNIYSISKDGYLMVTSPNTILDVYPVIALKPDLHIQSGDGMISSPYVVGD